MPVAGNNSISDIGEQASRIMKTTYEDVFIQYTFI